MAAFRPLREGSNEAKKGKGGLKAKTASQELVEANENRVALELVNDGANKVWVAYGKTAVAEEGIPLYPEGGSKVIENYSGIVSVITKSGESLVGFIEI